MSDTTPSTSTDRTAGGFSLASLALLVTVVAVFLTAVDIDRCQQQLGQMWLDDPTTLVAAFVAAAMIGGAIGLVRLFIDGFSWRMLLFKPICGSLMGIVALLILLAPGPLWRSLLAIGLLLATTNVLRLGSE